MITSILVLLHDGFIEFSDEYEELKGGLCNYHKKRYNSIMGAKTACGSDRSCLGFTGFGSINKRYYCICTNSSRITISSSDNMILKIKRSNAGTGMTYLKLL